MSEHVLLVEGASVPYRTQPSLLARLASWFRGSSQEDPTLPAWEPRYRYSPGMETPDARYHAVPGAVARKREAQARRVLRGGK